MHVKRPAMEQRQRRATAKVHERLLTCIDVFENGEAGGKGSRKEAREKGRRRMQQAVGSNPTQVEKRVSERVVRSSLVKQVKTSAHRLRDAARMHACMRCVVWCGCGKVGTVVCAQLVHHRVKRAVY
ncbi:hypothetical protein TEQG_00660 [Trichophyton equinum CBS 127.97]|uniref:Uncharacterized protein n=1 Tax=Trichophyton equinum (strain ATCC MYA-4606 / CBS 127.97) TaxID=559882 RepID=F2PI52_TRIEC|nr:hypothetical protein TEQG_00660 [Trichophyton equinum CBS 127.97]